MQPLSFSIPSRRSFEKIFIRNYQKDTLQCTKGESNKKKKSTSPVQIGARNPSSGLWNRNKQIPQLSGWLTSRRGGYLQYKTGCGSGYSFFFAFFLLLEIRIRFLGLGSGSDRTILSRIRNSGTIYYTYTYYYMLQKIIQYID